MNADNTAFLIAAGPTLYRSGDPREPFAMFSFECDDGWFQLLCDLTVRLETHSWLQNVQPDHRIRVQQVKEKYGTLRFYVENATAQQMDLICEAEELSTRTCEVCGQPGVLRGRGWLKTTCAEHAP